MGHGPVRRPALRRHRPARRQDRGDGDRRRKTLVAVLPLYLNALEGKGVHLVTVNDYLARRDSEWVGEILRWLGLSVAASRTR